MRVRYGTYTHAIGEAGISRIAETLYNEAGVAFATRWRWTMQAMLGGSSEADIAAKLTALQTAYATDGLDLVLLLSNGSQSPHILRSADCMGGTRVVQPPSYPDMRGAANVTHLNYTVVVEGDVRHGNGPRLESFREALQLQGGGRKFGYLEPLRGRPIRQLLKQQTKCVAVQSGTAVAYDAWYVPTAIFPAYQEEDYPPVTYEGPFKDGNGYYRFTTSWQYTFEADIRLIGKPRHWV